MHPVRLTSLLQIAEIKLRASGLARWAGNDDDPPIPTQPVAATAARPTWEQEGAEVDAARAAAAAVDAAAAAVDASAEPRQQEEQREQQQQPPLQQRPPPPQQQRWRAEAREEGLPSKGPFWRLTGSGFPEAAPLTAERQRQQQGTPAEQRQRRRQQEAEDDQQQEQADAALRPLQQDQQQQLQQLQRRVRQAKPQSLYLGVASVPLPPAGNRAGVDSVPPRTQRELNEQQEQKEQLQAAYPAFGLRRTSSSSGNGSTATAPTPTRTGNGSGTSSIPASLASLNGSSRAKPAPPVAAAEVHLRRLDTFDTLHRRAVAAITIDAPPEVRTCTRRRWHRAPPVCVTCCHANARRGCPSDSQYLPPSPSCCPPCRLCGLC